MKKASVEEYIRTIPDFPEKGIMFRDVTTVVKDPDGLQLAVDTFAEMVKDEAFDLIVGLEARGFLFGAPLAYKLHKGFVPVRKKGKLPAETISAAYDLEYGTAEVEIHTDAIKPGQRVVIIDDLIATGGSCEAACRLIKELGGEVVKTCFLLELCGLNGRKKLEEAGYMVESAVQYPGK